MTAEREGLVEVHGLRCMETPCTRCQIETVLDNHLPLRYEYATTGTVYRCTCGDWQPYVDEDAPTSHRAHLADALADLLAARDRRVRGEALREAAEEAEALRSFAHGKNPTSEAHLIGYGTARRGIVRLLRDRADRIEADA